MAPVTPTSTEDARRSRIAEREKAKASVSQELKKAQDQRHQDALAKDRLTVSVKPTPTQYECDMARLGHNIDVKEPDGSPEVGDHLHREVTAEGPTSGTGYQTRNLGSAPVSLAKRSEQADDKK